MKTAQKIHKKDEYAGKAYCLSTGTGEVVCSGEGYFDVGNNSLRVTFSHDSMARWTDVMVVLETTDGYFGTGYLHEVTAIPMGTSTQSYPMRTYLHWPKNKGINHVLSDFKNVYVSINARHVKPTGSWDDKTNSTELIQKGLNKDLSSGEYADYSVTLKARSGLSLGNETSSISTRLVFDIARAQRPFPYKEWLPLLLGFKLYWILNSDYTDCTIIKVEFGDSVTFITDENSLKAFRKNVTQYSSVPHISSDFSPELLAKSLHFFENPKDLQNLGVSSKIGLAFSRVIGYRYTSRHKRLDIEAIDLIFALQSFAESFAEQEINRLNKATKTATMSGIETVLAEIEKIKTNLPKSVQDFYLKEPSKIYEILARPSFKQSVTITLKKLGLNPEDYKKLIKIVDETRRQVVHSQGYDSQYLISTLITQARTNIGKNKEGVAVSMTFGEKTGSLDDLYELNKKLFFAYFTELKD